MRLFYSTNSHQSSQYCVVSRMKLLTSNVVWLRNAMHECFWLIISFLAIPLQRVLEEFLFYFLNLNWVLKYLTQFWRIKMKDGGFISSYFWRTFSYNFESVLRNMYVLVKNLAGGLAVCTGSAFRTKFLFRLRMKV